MRLVMCRRGKQFHERCTALHSNSRLSLTPCLLGVSCVSWDGGWEVGAVQRSLLTVLLAQCMKMECKAPSSCKPVFRRAQALHVHIPAGSAVQPAVPSIYLAQATDRRRTHTVVQAGPSTKAKGFGAPKPAQPVNQPTEVEPCPCGSGRSYKVRIGFSLILMVTWHAPSTAHPCMLSSRSMHPCTVPLAG